MAFTFKIRGGKTGGARDCSYRKSFPQPSARIRINHSTRKETVIWKV